MRTIARVALRLSAPAPADRCYVAVAIARTWRYVTIAPYEVVAVVFIGLMADAERLCDRTWWSVW